MYNTTGKKRASVDLKDYPELSPETGTAAGGMSLITTKEGLNILALALHPVEAKNELAECERKHKTARAKLLVALLEQRELEWELSLIHISRM